MPNHKHGIVAAMALLSVICSCQQYAPSPEQNITDGMVRLARMPRASSVDAVEAALQLTQGGLELKHRTEAGYGFKADDVVRWDAVRADAIIEDAIIDNIHHSGDPEQEIRLDLNAGTCITERMVRRATGVASKPYEDNWVPPPHYPSHYYHPASYNLEFVITDHYPTDQRKVFLAGDPKCYSVIVVKKNWKD